ncbi:MAG: hypothetical protein WD875_03685 [Pirellulales bacterium]
MSARRTFRTIAATTATSLVVLAGLSTYAAAQIDAEAVPGEPLGVGRISVRLADGATAGLSGIDALELTESSGRILYPARNAGLLGRLADPTDEPGRLTILFLFRGNEPLDVTLYTPTKQTVRITPGGRPRAHQRMLRQWWRQYNAAAQQMVDRGGYPAIVDHFLVAMLSRRLGLEPTVVGRKLFPSADEEQGLGLLLGTQSMHAAVLHEAMLGNRAVAADSIADQPMPKPVLPPLLAPEAAADVRVESIAKHVPEECYYVRFGSWSNYRWMRDLMNDFGGDLGNMISERGLDFDQSGRMETQLALRETALGNLLGSTAISDVAMIGMDMFYREGAAVGMLFEARNNLFGNDIAKQRTAAQEAHPDAKLSTVKIAGHDVSLLATPDNRVRSFYAVDGDYHLVTSCEAMVRRFFEAGGGKGSLGGSAEFRHARSELPTKRNDTIFAYLSDAFLRNLAGPHYRIEMARRLRSRVEMDVLTLARYSAKAEGIDAETPAELARAGFLPADFGVRADGSRLVSAEDGSMSDSLRGARGSFLPVPDVEVSQATRGEVADYARFADAYRDALGRVEPIIFAIRRRAGDQLKLDGDDNGGDNDDNGDNGRRDDKSKADLETLSIEARVSPFTGKTYETIAARLGPPTKQYVAPLKGNLISVSAHLRNGSLGGEFGGLLGGLLPAGPPPEDAGSRLLFVGLDDFSRPVAAPNNLLGWLAVLQQANGYVGSWPDAGMLARMLGMDEPLPENELGYREIFARLGVWGLKLNEFTVVALHKDDLLERARQLRVVESDRPAQIRLRAGDLTGTNVAKMLTRLGYERTWTGSTGNARYLHRLAEQLHIPRSDARSLAENLCGAKLICPLGGEYKVEERADGPTSWVSTAWQAGEGGQDRSGDSTPDGYAPPPLVWFRGLEADAALEPGRFTLRAELVVERKSKGGLGIPSLFGN